MPEEVADRAEGCSFAFEFDGEGVA